MRRLIALLAALLALNPSLGWAQVLSGPTTTAVTQTAGNSSTKIANTAFVGTAITNAIAAVNPAVATQAATNAILPNSPIYANGVSGIGATITTASLNTPLVVDGYTPVLGDRILVKNESGGLGASRNGIYTVTTVSGVGVAWLLTRALDFDQPSDMNNTGSIPVVNGTSNASTSWLLTSTVNTVGTDAVTFAQFSISPATIVTLGGVSQVLTGGFHFTSFNIGTVSSGTTTIDCGNSPSQYLTDNGAFTLAAPASDGQCMLLVTNGASAGAITFSGFTVGATQTGAALTTTNTNVFYLSILRVNGKSSYFVQAGQ